VCGKDFGVRRSRSVTGSSGGDIASIRAPVIADRVRRTAIPQRTVQAAGRQTAGDTTSCRGHRWRGRGRVRGRPAVSVR